MNWLPLFSTILGAAIALSGSLLAGRLTAREHLGRERETFRRTVYVDFSTALDAAHFALRTVAREAAPGHEPGDGALAAVADSGLYRTREHLLMFGPAAVVSAGEAAFLAVIELRRAVQAGAALSSAEYHLAYHAFAERIWNFRMAVREDVGEHPFAPRSLGRSEWSEREDCPVCADSAPQLR